MHACMFYIFEVKLLPGILETVLIYSEVQFDITTCKCDLRMLNLTCKHLQLYVNLYTENYNDILQVARTQDRYIAMHEQ